MYRYNLQINKLLIKIVSIYQPVHKAFIVRQIYTNDTFPQFMQYSNNNSGVHYIYKEQYLKPKAINPLTYLLVVDLARLS